MGCQMFTEQELVNIANTVADYRCRKLGMSSRINDLAQFLIENLQNWHQLPIDADNYFRDSEISRIANFLDSKIDEWFHAHSQ